MPPISPGAPGLARPPQPFDPATELDWGDPVLSRRLLREHLDQDHDSASRRIVEIERHVSRLRRLLPQPPAEILDAACGPGLYAVRLGRAGYAVTGIDIGPAVLRYARAMAREWRVDERVRFVRADLRDATPTAVAAHGYDAVLLIYYVLEAFPRRRQATVLRRLAEALRPGGVVVAELRVRPEMPPGRLSHWDIVDRSLLGDRPHLLLTDTHWDPRRRVHVLREFAVLGDGSMAVQQSTGALTTLVEARALVAAAGLELRAVYDGWSRHPATGLSESLLVVARRPLSRPRSSRVRGARG